MDKKKFLRLAFAGLLVGRVVPVASAPNNVASDVDAALQQARTAQQMSTPALDDGSSFDVEDETVGLY